VGKAERRLERHRRRWEDNIKIDIKEIKQKRLDRIYLSHSRALVETVVKFQIL
jgi:hypothetical protein